ncbi:hypothetical protein pdam_00001660 [Pocillopora damicornis]|uniref:Uncharacterized protein n=1 Tax=Pocillopora damicornis TaxID=46731 RepID=A0A3M6UPX7_POCDA|nr:hypothetical protein pdam_00001660 [Pocillopora damicornis]
MATSTLIEVFGQIVYRLTRSVTEHYNPEEPEFTTESFGYDPLLSTGREWYKEPVDELIYQEYSDREATNSNFFAHNINVQVINAFLPEDSGETRVDQNVKEEEMTWKRLRPSFSQTLIRTKKKQECNKDPEVIETNGYRIRNRFDPLHTNWN